MSLDDLKSIFLCEDFELRGDTIFWTGQKGLPNIDTRFGKGNFQFRVATLPQSKVKVLSLYKKDSSEETTNILKALKGQQSKYTVDENSLDHFINRSAVFAVRKISQMNIDYIITVRSSSSLVTRFQNKILSMLPDKNVIGLPHLIDKNIKGLHVDTGDIEVDQKTLTSMEKKAETARKAEQFKIKEIPPMLRKFFRNWLKIDDHELNKLDGSNAIILDDYLTTGATLDEACLLLKKAGIKELVALTLIK